MSASAGWRSGLPIYVIYRRADEISLLKRVTVSPQILRAEPSQPTDYGSILVPLFGTDLDEDIVHTAALLAAGKPTDEAAIDDATIEAVWIFVIPMSLPIDARLPEAQVRHARQALARAKVVGEEYSNVHVATATVRTRRAGFAIVDEARRRGVEAIVLGAEPPSLIRGGARLGGRGGPLENFAGDVTKFVVGKADCRVILTAPSEHDVAARPPVPDRPATPAMSSKPAAPATPETPPTAEAPLTPETPPTAEAPLTPEAPPTAETPLTAETPPRRRYRPHPRTRRRGDGRGGVTVRGSTGAAHRILSEQCSS